MQQAEQSGMSFAPILIVTRKEVINRDTSSIVEALRSMLASPGRARSYFERVDLAFSGYDNVADELFEIPEVRDYVHELDEQFPFWLFFLDKGGLGLQCLAYCFVPPFLTPAAEAEAVPAAFDNLLTKRWFPAMNQVCEWVGMSEEEIEELSDRSVAYLLAGPQVK